MEQSPIERKLLYVADRKAWRDWLQQHYKSESEVWLVYHKKHSGKPRIPYNDAVEEALCFGWIDSIVKSVDADRFAQRFSVRNPKTPYSQANKERLRELVRQGKVVEFDSDRSMSDVYESAYLGDCRFDKPNRLPSPVHLQHLFADRPGRRNRTTYLHLSPSKL